MSTALHRPMTLDEFLAWELDREPKWEFDGTAPVAMTGVSIAHSRIQTNLLRHVANRLVGGPCYILGPELRLVAAGSVRYPDALILCAPKNRDAREVDDPVIVFEIISPTTARTDRIVKVREYGATASIGRYVLLEQEAIAATVFARRGGDWAGHVLTEADDLALPEVGISLALTELYDGLDFPAEETPRE